MSKLLHTTPCSLAFIAILFLVLSSLQHVLTDNTFLPIQFHQSSSENAHIVNSSHLNDGQVTIIWSNGDKYSGYVKSTQHGNVKNGHGVYTDSEGNKYDGEWKDDQKDGYGIITLSNGVQQYQGQFEQNELCRGLFTYDDGSTYEGAFKNGQRHGHGVYKDVKGNIYEGEYNDNKKHGHGKIIDANGNTYDGEWENGVMSGYGILTTFYGKLFKGEFRNGVRSGYGIMRYSNGTTKECYWDNEKCIGNVVVNGEIRKNNEPTL